MKKIIINIFKSILCICLISSSLFFVIGCKPTEPSLPPVVTMMEPFKEQGIHVTAKAYTSEESKAYLDQNLHRVGLQPVQITIQNHTDRIYALSLQGVETPLASGSEAARYITSLSIPRSIGLKVAGFIFWPFIFPSVIDTILTVKSHQKMKRDFQAKGIKDYPEYILQYSTVHRIIFIPKEAGVDEFTLNLTDRQTLQNHSFPVKIQ